MTTENIQELVREVEKRLPKAVINVREGKRGAMILTVSAHQRAFVLERFPDGQYGVDEIDETNNGWNMGYRSLFAEFAPAVEELVRLVDARKVKK
jgi:hypothetical protein